MTDADLAAVLERVPRDARGLLRTLASRKLEGAPAGPFSFEGIRMDDPNDRIPHQHRRELRGFRIISAWLNNTDIRPGNTLDMYIGPPGKGYLRHNLFDFGTSLGSTGNDPKLIRTGYELYVDYHEILRNLTAIGGHVPYWRDNIPSANPAVGMFESDNFDPLRWSPNWSNRAFEAMTDRDAFWATRIIARFSNDDIDSLVSAAHYSDPDAAAEISRVLAERRDKIKAIWFNRVTPLDEFRLQFLSTGLSLTFDDLGVTTALATPDRRTCIARVSSSDDPSPVPADVLNPSPGRHAVPFPQEFHSGHMRFDLDLISEGRPVGKRVYVFAFCSSPLHCVISSLSHHRP